MYDNNKRNVIAVRVCRSLNLNLTPLLFIDHDGVAPHYWQYRAPMFDER